MRKEIAVRFSWFLFKSGSVFSVYVLLLLICMQPRVENTCTDRLSFLYPILKILVLNDISFCFVESSLHCYVKVQIKILWLFRIPLWIIHPISVLCFVKRFVKMKAKSCIEIQISFINLFPVFLIHIFVFNCIHSWIRRANKCAIKMNIVVAISLSFGSNDEWNEWADTCSFLHFYVWTSCGRQYEFGHRKDLFLYSCLPIFRNLHSFHFHKRTNDFFVSF